MAESASQKTSYQIKSERLSVLTGDDISSRQLEWQLKNSIAHAQRIDIMVSFLMEASTP